MKKHDGWKWDVFDNIQYCVGLERIEAAIKKARRAEKAGQWKDLHVGSDFWKGVLILGYRKVTEDE